MKEINSIILVVMTMIFITSTFLMWNFDNDVKISIITNIEKHSVHPRYGNYKKIDSKGRTCEPWDSCK